MKATLSRLNKTEMIIALNKANDRILSLESQVAGLEGDLFEMREIISGVKALNRVPGLYERINIFNSILRDYMDSNISAFFLYWPEEQVFRLAEGKGLPERINRNFSFKRFEGLFWELTCQAEVFTAHAPDGADRFSKMFKRLGLEGTGLEFFVPLSLSGEPIGLAAFAPSDMPNFSNDFYPQRFAAQAAPSIKTSVLFETNQQDKQALDRTLKNLRMLYNIGRLMGHISDLRELLNFILNEACRTTEAQKGSIMLFDEETKSLVIRVVQGVPDPALEKKINEGEITCASFKPGEGVAGRVFQDKRTIVVNDVAANEEFSNKDQANVQSILCAPLVVNDEAIGVINITNKKELKPFTDEDQQLILALASQAAISIHRSQLYNLAIKDELTGLFIRRFFAQRVAEEIKRADRYHGEFTVIMVDIDHFKKINDTYGHLVGDKALVALARSVESSLRSSDLVSRYGGEEFAILLPETTAEGALPLAERIRQKVESLIVPEMGRNMTISLGIAVYPKHGSDLTGLIKSADMALYQAKHEGRNRVILWDLG
jgi:diguanylate cyclase (GGDEF)-like protein